MDINFQTVYSHYYHISILIGLGILILFGLLCYLSFNKLKIVFIVSLNILVLTSLGLIDIVIEFQHIPFRTSPKLWYYILSYSTWILAFIFPLLINISSAHKWKRGKWLTFQIIILSILTWVIYTIAMIFITFSATGYWG
jgi:hypothetical protein